VNLQLQGQLMNAAKCYKEQNWMEFWFTTGAICTLLGFKYEGPCKELWDAAHSPIIEGSREKAWAVILQLMLKEGLELLEDLEKHRS